MIREVDGAVELTLYLQPSASKTEVVGVHGGALKLRVAAPPVDGEANDELIRFLAKALGVPKSAVAIMSGATGRTKRVRVEGVSLESAGSRLGVGS